MCLQEYTNAGVVGEKRQELDALAQQVESAETEAQRRLTHVAAGDAALANLRELLVSGDLQVCYFGSNGLIS